MKMTDNRCTCPPCRGFYEGTEIERLQKQLEQKDAQIAQLKNRIDVLETNNFEDENEIIVEQREQIKELVEAANEIEDCTSVCKNMKPYRKRCLCGFEHLMEVLAKHNDRRENREKKDEH